MGPLESSVEMAAPASDLIGFIAVILGLVDVSNGPEVVVVDIVFGVANVKMKISVTKKNTMFDQVFA